MATRPGIVRFLAAFVVVVLAVSAFSFVLLLPISPTAHASTGLPPPPLVNGENASLVIGQPDFTSALEGTSQNQLSWPRGVAFDSWGDMWVPDTSNNRVLEFVPGTPPCLEGEFCDGMPASVVLGQQDFSSNGYATDQYSFHGPRAIAFDGAGDLWVADTANDRVLEFVPGTAPCNEGQFCTGMPASVVIGQPDFATVSCSATCGVLGLAFDSAGNLWVSSWVNNEVSGFTSLESGSTNPAAVISTWANSEYAVSCMPSSPTCNQLSSPTGIAIQYSSPDSSDDGLYVADSGNNRVLFFSLSTPLFGIPFSVFGQNDLSTTSCTTSGSGLCFPTGIAFDGSGDQWIADSGNNRLLEFPPNEETISGYDLTASTVIGQPDFASANSETTQSGLSLTVAGNTCVTEPAFAPDGTLWMGDCLNNRILQYGPNPTIVLCTPTSFAAGASSTCTAEVLDGAFPTGTVTFSQSSGSGTVGFSPDYCTLPSIDPAPSCSVTVTGNSAGNATILATYSGDESNPGSSGSHTVGIYVSTPTTTSSSGGASVDQTSTTGVRVDIAGSSPNTPITISTTDLGSSQPTGTTSSGLDVEFFDVEVSGITTGTAYVYITSSAVMPTTLMEYWDGTQWASPISYEVGGTTICGAIPVSALTGAPIGIGHHSPHPPSTADPTICSSLPAPTISAAPAAVGVGQASALSVTSPLTGGTAPYTCQWLHEAPGAAVYSSTGSSFGCNAGAQPSTSTGALPTIGAWSFELQVTDSFVVPVTVTSNAVTVMVSAVSTTTVLACLPLKGIPGVPETCAVVVADNRLSYNVKPSGTVTFTGTLPRGMPTGCSLSGGTGIFSLCSVSWTPGTGSEGSYSIIASYGGDSTHAPSSTQGSLTIAKRGVSVSISCSGPYVHGSPTVCKVTVIDISPGKSITPTGSVTFSSSGAGGFLSKSCTLSGSGATASCYATFVPSSKGSYTLTASYQGDTDHVAGTASITFKVS